MRARDLGCAGRLGDWRDSECSGLAQPSESTEGEARPDSGPRMTQAASSNQHGGPKQKNYTHFFNAFYIIHIHLDILQGRRQTQNPRNDSQLGFYFSPLIPYIFHSVRSAVDVFLVPNIARHSEFYGKMLNHCGGKVWDQPRPKNQNKTKVKVETWLTTLRGSGTRKRGWDVYDAKEEKRLTGICVCWHNPWVMHHKWHLSVGGAVLDNGHRLHHHHHHIKIHGEEHWQ